MCVVSKVDEVMSQSTDSVIRWLDALNPLVIRLKRCIEVMCSRATVGLSFFALQVLCLTFTDVVVMILVLSPSCTSK